MRQGARLGGLMKHLRPPTRSKQFSPRKLSNGLDHHLAVSLGRMLCLTARLRIRSRRAILSASIMSTDRASTMNLDFHLEEPISKL
jgi:hypothetical protein